ncbi:hypothetical protein [Microcella alkaliphila]|uniref:hypothetical protein n=1 Tax=Microcella alkaliphila TaxID=279828 RepID=UPI0013002B38
MNTLVSSGIEPPGHGDGARCLRFAAHDAFNGGQHTRTHRRVERANRELQFGRVRDDIDRRARTG